MGLGRSFLLLIRIFIELVGIPPLMVASLFCTCLLGLALIRLLMRLVRMVKRLRVPLASGPRVDDGRVGPVMALLLAPFYDLVGSDSIWVGVVGAVGGGLGLLFGPDIILLETHLLIPAFCMRASLTRRILVLRIWVSGGVVAKRGRLENLLK